MTKKIRVLIVDDSAVTRSVLTRELAPFSDIEIVGTAADPYIARDKIVALRPDVITLDVEMPRMDGITFLRKLMEHFPTPAIVLSTLTGRGTEHAVAALEAGAVDVLAKPSDGHGVQNIGGMLSEKIRVVARATVRRLDPVLPPPPKPTAPAAVSAAAGSVDRLIAIGASTGGVQALTTVLTQFPANAPATLVVQHMPEKFTASFAARLNAMCAVEVKEAADGDLVVPGRVLLAPGGRHMLLRKAGTRFSVQLKDGPPVFHQRPSVEVTFDSVTKCAGNIAVGAILTGMGCDGARALLSMRQAGARTLAQDEATSVVFGMPGEAVRCGAAERVVPLDKIAGTLMKLARPADIQAA